VALGQDVTQRRYEETLPVAGMVQRVQVLVVGGVDNVVVGGEGDDQGVRHQAVPPRLCAAARALMLTRVCVLETGNESLSTQSLCLIHSGDHLFEIRHTLLHPGIFFGDGLRHLCFGGGPEFEDGVEAAAKAV